ncbi:hypothetical protein [Geomicrobium sp. JCM 19055]|uniref:hypothetical protein n=1 Tax=Geomicrobium sp. JCM 19055 TaxID=1460649 RepID=UPI000AAC597F
MFQLIQQTGEQIGVQVTEVATGGSSDASFTSVMDVATIDGMGLLVEGHIVRTNI